MRRTPTQSSPSAKDTGPRYAITPWSDVPLVLVLVRGKKVLGDAGLSSMAISWFSLRLNWFIAVVISFRFILFAICC